MSSLVAIHFYDTSAVAKRYFAEPGSGRVESLLTDPDSVHVISRLTLAEVVSAIVRRVPAEAAIDLLERFENDASVVFSTTTLDDNLFDEAVALVKRHRLRGCDSLQLASAVRLAADGDSVIFVCADNELNKAATAEGLPVLSPLDARSR